MFDNYIVKGIGGFYYVKTGGSLVECKPKGIFRKKRITPVAGDIVRLETDGGAHVIADILPRKNVFVRPPVANVDQFFIVVSTVQPVPSTLVIDKLSAIAVDKGAQPVLVITKTDLQDAQPLAACYAHSDIPVLCVNARTGEGLDAVRARLDGRLSVFCGNSGVGKSTLLSALLPGHELETGEISQKLGRGRHTTRHVELYHLSCGGDIVDSPGFSSFETDELNLELKHRLPETFREFAPYLGACRFVGCSHTKEKGCAVLEALRAGKLQPSRHASYVRLFEELKPLQDWQEKKK